MSTAPSAQQQRNPAVGMQCHYYFWDHIMCSGRQRYLKRLQYRCDHQRLFQCGKMAAYTDPWSRSEWQIGELIDSRLAATGESLRIEFVRIAKNIRVTMYRIGRYEKLAAFTDFIFSQSRIRYTLPGQ
jgi:hypothetical protein